MLGSFHVRNDRAFLAPDKSLCTPRGTVSTTRILNRRCEQSVNAGSGTSADSGPCRASPETARVRVGSRPRRPGTATADAGDPDPRPLAFDRAILADLRFPGGTSTAIASEVAILARAGYRVVLLPVHVLSPIAEEEAGLATGVASLRVFPLARYAATFEVAVSAAGYNTSHELVGAGLPTVFVPSEHPMMDRQLLRARWAERCGLGLCLRVAELPAARAVVARLLDPAFRDGVRARAARRPAATGAAEAARLVREMAFTVRAHRPG